MKEDKISLEAKTPLYDNKFILQRKRNMRVKSIDLSKILEPYEGQWVALTPDAKKVLGASKNLDEALRQAKSKGFPRPYLVKSPCYEVMGSFFE